MEPAKGNSTLKSETTILIDALKKTLLASDPAAPATRVYLKETAEKLSVALETPGDTVQRIAYYVRFLPNLHAFRFISNLRLLSDSSTDQQSMKTACANDFCSYCQQIANLPHLGEKHCTRYRQRARAKDWR